MGSGTTPDGSKKTKLYFAYHVKMIALELGNRNPSFFVHYF